MCCFSLPITLSLPSAGSLTTPLTPTLLFFCLFNSVLSNICNHPCHLLLVLKRSSPRLHFNTRFNPETGKKKKKGTIFPLLGIYYSSLYKMWHLRDDLRTYRSEDRLRGRPGRWEVQLLQNARRANVGRENKIKHNQKEQKHTLEQPFNYLCAPFSLTQHPALCLKMVRATQINPAEVSEIQRMQSPSTIWFEAPPSCWISPHSTCQKPFKYLH